MLSILIGTAAAQKDNSKNKKTNNQTKTSKKEKVYKTVDRRTRSFQGSRDDDKKKSKQDKIKISPKATAADAKETIFDDPEESKLNKGGEFNGDLSTIPYKKPEFIKDKPKHEHVGENEILIGDPVEEGSGLPADNFAPAPGPLANFIGLDLSTFGTGYPPDTVGDVGPNHFIQSVNSSIGIYRKSDGVRLVGLSINSFMNPGFPVGNLCKSSNRGDPVVLYDSFEDRWIITDFAFTTDGGGNITSSSYQCFAVSKTGDPVAGGWNYYSTIDTDLFGDYGKFGVWTDGIYMSANMFGFNSGGAFGGVRVRALNKAQMYAGAPTVQVVVFNAPSGEFSMMPANARLQTGTPPAGTPNLFSVVWQFTNVISVYKFKVDWEKVSTSTFTGPFMSFAPASWGSPPSTVPAQGGNNNDTLAVRLMMQNQYTNIGGVESLWNSHTVLGAVAGQSAPRFYQVNVTGGIVANNTTQALTHAPDSTISRYMPSLAVNRNGDMAIGYSASSSGLPPAIRYAGRLSTDPVNTLPQTEATLINGPGAQTFSTRWGDYSTTTLDPNGCTFWLTNEYYAAVGTNWQTRIGSFELPGCTQFTNDGALEGTVTSVASGLPINGATITFGSRTATTNASGFYSFTNIPEGTYLTDTASATGYLPSTASNIVVNDGNTTTQNFSLATAAANACLVDTSQSDFQTAIPTNIDLNTNPGDATLTQALVLDAQNVSVTTSGFGFNSTSWFGQTFTAGTTGPLTKADISLFCSSCSGTTPNITVSLRATSGDLPTGPDLATATIAGFGSFAGNYYTATFGTPATVTSGTQYALVVRSVSNPSAGTYAYFVSTGSPYAGGRRVTSTNSGSTWTGQTTDVGFRTYITAGYSLTGNLVSSTKDANPVVSGTTTWTTLSWSATTPANTSVRFQAAGSNDPDGPFNFVGPDTTSGTFFTTSGASLSQFNGMRYVKYKAYLATTDSNATPTLEDVTICYTNPRVWTGAVSTDWDNAGNWSSGGVPGVSDKAIIPNAGVTNAPTNTSDVTVGSLQLDAEIIDTGANTLTVSTCSPTAISGGTATSYVKGSLTRCINNAGAYNFPVGTTNGYSPVSLNNISGSGNFNVSPVQGFLTDTDNTKSIQRYWGLTKDPGVTQTDITFNYLDADVPVTATESNLKFIRRTGSINVAFPPSSMNTATNTFTLNGVGFFSDWGLGALSPTAAGVSVSGKVLTASGRAIPNANVVIRSANGETRTVRTNSFGNYRFDDVLAGDGYIMTVNSKQYTFQSRVVNVIDNLVGFDFVANSTGNKQLE